MARTGRRRGNQDTREAILVASRAAFAERGYDGASIRAIATSAGVDPALVHHYFGTKDQLFIAAMQFPIDPGEVIPAVVVGDRAHLGERIVRAVLAVWDSPAGATAAAMVRSSVQQEWMARMLRDFLMTQVVRRVARSVGMPAEEAAYRAPLVMSQLLGVIVTRYIIRVEPLASMDPEMVVRLIGPTIQHYIVDPLPPITSTSPGDQTA